MLAVRLRITWSYEWARLRSRRSGAATAIPARLENVPSRSRGRRRNPWRPSSTKQAAREVPRQRLPLGSTRTKYPAFQLRRALLSSTSILYIRWENQSATVRVFQVRAPRMLFILNHLEIYLD